MKVKQFEKSTRLVIMFCPTCQAARENIKSLMGAQWNCLISQYEFMVVFASFRRNILFYSCMEHGQLRNLYSELVSYSPAKILIIDTLISKYRKTGMVNGALNPLDVPGELFKLITLLIGNQVPEQFLRECVLSATWKGHTNMILAMFASAEAVRSGPLKFIAIVKEMKRDRAFHQTIISLAVTAWTVELSDHKCTCGTWMQALDLLSCFVPDTETTLAIQEVARISAYICTLLDISPALVNSSHSEDKDNKVLNYAYVFKDLLVSGIDRKANDQFSPQAFHLPTPQHSIHQRRT